MSENSANKPPSSGEQRFTPDQILAANTEIRTRLMGLLRPSQPRARMLLVLSPDTRHHLTEAFDTPDVNDDGTVNTEGNMWTNSISKEGEERIFRAQPKFHSDIIEEGIHMFDGALPILQVSTSTWDEKNKRSWSDGPTALAEAMRILDRLQRQMNPRTPRRKKV